MCALWVLALLWISAPGHDLASALISERMASWVQAIGSILAIVAVVGLAQWEVDRTRREAVRHNDDLLNTLIQIADAMAEECRAFKSTVQMRSAMGLSIASVTADLREKFTQLSNSLNRAFSVKPGDLGTTLLAESLISLLGRGLPVGSADFVRITIEDVESQIRNIAGRARARRSPDHDGPL